MRNRMLTRCGAALLVTGLLAAATAPVSLAAVPHTINYQGRLSNNAMPPTPVTATLPMTFSLWDTATGGSQLWSESWGAVSVIDGIFNVSLGSQTPIPSSVFNGQSRWLELTVDGEILLPRQPLASVSYSYLAEGSDALGGVAAAGWQRRIEGTCPANSSIRVVDVNGNVTCETDDTGAGGLPAGAVVFFNTAVCPTGWTELVALRGRYPVGLPAGGTLLGTAGTALGNLENRPVGLHNHSINDPQHRHSYTPPVATSTGSGASQAGVGASTQTGFSATGITINNAGTVAGTNAPYVQLLACQKD